MRTDMPELIAAFRTFSEEPNNVSNFCVFFFVCQYECAQSKGDLKLTSKIVVSRVNSCC